MSEKSSHRIDAENSPQQESSGLGIDWQQTYSSGASEQFFWDGYGAENGTVLAGAAIESEQAGRPWVVKIDDDGSEIWNRAYPGEGIDAEVVSSAVPAHDGGTILVGSVFYDVDDSGSSQPDFDAVVTKIDDDGRRQWRRTHGGSSTDRAYGGIALQDSGYLLYGFTYSYTNSSGHDLWARKVDNEGTAVWDKTVGTDPSFFANDGVATADGGAVLAGGRWYTDDRERNQLVVKLSGRGREEWSRTFGSNDLDSRLVTAARTADGYVVSGEDGDRGLLRGLGSDGTETWRTDLGTGIVASALHRTDDGRFLVGGRQSQGSGAALWLGEVDADRRLVWDETFEQGGVREIISNDGTTIAAGQLSGDGWAGALSESAGRSATETDDTEREQETTDTNVFGPGFGPLTALAGIGLGAYRYYRQSESG